jgi:hypothetical protein
MVLLRGLLSLVFESYDLWFDNLLHQFILNLEGIEHLGMNWMASSIDESFSTSFTTSKLGIGVVLSFSTFY